MTNDWSCVNNDISSTLNSSITIKTPSGPCVDNSIDSSLNTENFISLLRISSLKTYWNTFQEFPKDYKIHSRNWSWRNIRTWAKWYLSKDRNGAVNKVLLAEQGPQRKGWKIDFAQGNMVKQCNGEGKLAVERKWWIIDVYTHLKWIFSVKSF